MSGNIFALGIAISLHVAGFCTSTSTDHNLDSIQTQERNAALVHGIVNRTIHSLDRSDSSEISLEYYFYQPSQIGMPLQPYQRTVNEIMYENTLWNTLSENNDALPKRPINALFFENQLDTVVRVFKESQEEYDFGQVWFLDMLSRVTDHKQYVDLLLEEYNYLGGAHGNSSIVHYQIDRTTGEVLGLKDFFTDLNAVNGVAEKYFRELYDLEGLESWEDSDFWFSGGHFEVSDIFTIDGKTVSFYYNPYAIAPYYYGQILVEIPVAELRPFMTQYCLENL